jgi:hypothetical protein
MPKCLTRKGRECSQPTPYPHLLETLCRLAAPHGLYVAPIRVQSVDAIAFYDRTTGGRVFVYYPADRRGEGAGDSSPINEPSEVARRAFWAAGKWRKSTAKTRN